MQVATDVKVFTCICCPLGCPVEVCLGQDGSVAEVTGCTCKRGAEYAAREAVRPERMVTVVLPVEGCLEPVSAKTLHPVPKDLVRDVLSALGDVRLAAPIAAGTVLVDDVCGTGVPVVATKSVP